MASLVKSGDLIPDEWGFVTKEQTIEAMLSVGISEKAAVETADDNFDHLPDPKRLNLFLMNTIITQEDMEGMIPDPPGPLEHFRSTGIRDRRSPSAFLYQKLDDCQHFDEIPGEFSVLDVQECVILVWDHENKTEVFDSRPAVLNSNDVNEDKRPDTCLVTDSGRVSCPSQLHGSINFFMHEFGTPTGMKAVMTADEMRNLWLLSEFPAAFEARSPRHCIDKEDPTAEGCSACLDLVGDAVAGSVEAQRYCRCLLAKRLSQTEVDLIPDYTRLGCPTCCFATKEDSDGRNATEALARGMLREIDGCEPYCVATGSFSNGI